jgi:hypothetical protein
MNIKTKFKVGDQVFIIKQKTESYHNDCETCGGTGKVHIRETGAELDCPLCSGKGYDVEFDTNYYKEDAIVNKILTRTTDQGTEIIFSLLVGGQYIDLPEKFVLSLKDADKILESGKVQDYVTFFGSSLIMLDQDFMMLSNLNTANVSSVDAGVGDKIIDISTGKVIPKKLF